MKRLSLILMISCLVVPSAFAGPACRSDTTKGSWVYTCEGLLPGPQLTPTRMLGHCTANRTADWNCEGTVNLGGQIIPQQLTGQANNLPNCTGKISYQHTLGGASAGSLDIQFVIHDSGNAIHGLPVNSGGVLACTLRRINANN